MTSKKPTSKKEAPNAEALMRELEHPHKAGINTLRTAIKKLDPRIQEEVKWNAPSYKLEDHFATFKLFPPTQIQLVLHRGAKPKPLDKPLELPDTHGLLKWAAPDRCVLSLKSSEQAVELESEVQELVRLWMAQLSKPKAAEPKGAAGVGGRSAASKKKNPAVAAEPALLAGGNPQIVKADGDAPVQAYIAAMPGWKRDVARRIDALIVRNVPNVRKAMKWNSPLYGIDGQGWFLGLHAFTSYVKVTFFKGTSLVPAPPGGTAKDARSVDVHEGDLDEAQLATWVKQAAAVPGWVTSDIR